MSVLGPLSYEVFVSPTHSIDGDRGTFSPVTSTLVYGDRDLMLVDAQFIDDDVTALGDTIEATGRRLTTIVATHGHGDHWYGAHALQARFPGAVFVTTAGVAAYVDQHWDQDRAWMTGLFGDRVTLPAAGPESVDTDSLVVEGHEVQVIEVGQGDIDPSCIVSVPTLNLVVAGDIVYNQIHPMLAFGGPPEWQRWIASVDTIERLHPCVVVAGHKRPDAPDDQVADILEGTRAYIRDFTAAVETADSARDVVTSMSGRYPDHGNLTTLIASATAAMSFRSQQR